jgi:asparagine synthase (glutamine-hydrolysing)
MCGLNGIFAYHPAARAPSEAELLATRDAMRVRGPDGSGAWWSEGRRCALGHRRLAIIDLSDRALQPMISENGQFVVVFNGEIYNFPALKTALETEGVHFRTTSDTEVLLHLYAREGAEMVHKLRGMFAFAIWDENRRGLFLARDPFGIKPLYTANDGWTFRFASQVKALLAGKNLSSDPESAGIIGFNLFGSVPEPFTLYREIRCLPAGCTQWIDSAGPREPRLYSSIAAIISEAEPASRLAEKIRASMLDSVRAHQLADVPVGIFLSAGIDSGSLLGLMRDTGSHNIKGVTVAFEEFRGTTDDEAPLAAITAERYGASQSIRRVSEREFSEDLPVIFNAMDQPSIDGVNTWFVAKAAKEAGLKVAVSGLGADELLGGYPSFRTMPRWHHRFGMVAAIPGVGRLARKLIEIAMPDTARSRPKSLGLLRYANTWPGLYLLQRGLFLPHELSDFLDADFVREGMRRLRPLRRIAENLVPDPGSEFCRICALESSLYLRNQLLRDADWAGMAHSLEIRVPFVDTTLLKSVVRTIAGLKSGTGKAALAKTPSLPLPNEVVARAKTGFSVPTGSWLANAVVRKAGSKGYANKERGLVSRSWSRIVLSALSPPDVALAP